MQQLMVQFLMQRELRTFVALIRLLGGASGAAAQHTPSAQQYDLVTCMLCRCVGVVRW